MPVVNSVRTSRFMHKVFHSVLIITLLLGQLSMSLPVQASPVGPVLSVTPLTWNVVGLDSNNVNVGPNNFPVGARVCNTGDQTASGVTSSFIWTNVNDPNKDNIYLRPDSSDKYETPADLPAGSCKDHYYEIEVKRASSSYGKTRQFTIDFFAGTAPNTITGTTPTPREIFVEKLVSQNRNSVQDVRLNDQSIGVGNTMTLVVGNTYKITLEGLTSTGYNQLESFINISNTIFRVNSVHTTFEQVSLAPASSDMLYADSCGWDSDPTSPTYRSCVVSDGKSGGKVVVDYNVTILSGYSSSQTLSSMFYDFSGSSYHYNADYPVKTRYVSVVAPVVFSKSFPAKSVAANTDTALSFNMVNTGSADVTGVTFSDPLPSTPAQMTVASSPNITLSSGCTIGSALTVTTPSGIPTLNFAGGVKANGTCTVSIQVHAPSSPTTGTYANITSNLIVNSVDTGQKAAANLEVSSTVTPQGVCGVNLAQWAMPNTTLPPAAVTANPGITASASVGSGLSSAIDTSLGNPANSLRIYDFANKNALDTTLNEYIQFEATTTGYSGIGFSFDAEITATKGPASLVLYSSTNGTAFTAYGSTISPTGAWVTYAPAFTGTANTNGKTYFRIYGYNPGNPGNSDNLYIDNIKITGCGPAQPQTLSKSFTPSTISADGKSTLKFTLGNPNSQTLTQVSFMDKLPQGLAVASPANVTNSSPACTGTFAASGSDISLTNGTIPAGGCWISLDVTGSTVGTYVNTTGFISSKEGGTNTSLSDGAGTATLNVVAAPVFTKSFGPNPIYAGQTSKLTFSIFNPNSITLAGIGFTDSLYTNATNGNLTVASPANVSAAGCNQNSDPNYQLTAAAGANSIQLASASIAPGDTCKISVNVTTNKVFNYPNTVSLTTSVSGLTVLDASDTLAVVAVHPGIKLLKQVASDPEGVWSSFLYTVKGGPVYYRLRIENVGDQPLTNITVTDPDPAISLSGCKWPVVLPVPSTTQDGTAACIVGPFFASDASLVSGVHSNTAQASGMYNSTSYTSSSTAKYAITNLVLVKTASENSFSTAGDFIHYSYQVSNTSDTPVPGPITITDNRAAVTCPPIESLSKGEPLTCDATYTVTALDVATASVTNSAYALAGGVRSNTARKTVYINQPELTITQTNDAGGYAIKDRPFNWLIKVKNMGPQASDFTAGQTVLTAQLPLTGAAYAAPVVISPTGITGTGTLACSIDTDQLMTCTASAGNVTIAGTTGTFTVKVETTPSAAGTLTSTSTVDPDHLVAESNETNNTAADILPVVAMTAPKVTKSFGSETLGAGGVVALTLTLSNPASNPEALVGVRVDDLFPSGMMLQNTTFTYTPAECGMVTNLLDGESLEGDEQVRFAVPSINPGSSCQVSLNVTSLTEGSVTNTTQAPTAAGPVSLTGSTAAAPITVNAFSTPTVSKAFGGPILKDGYTSLTVTLGNTNPDAILTTRAFIDTFPEGVKIYSTGSTTTCDSATVTAVAGNNFFSLASGASIPSGGCTVAVDVTGSAVGAFTNTIAIDALQTNLGNNAQPANATLNVYGPPEVTKVFEPATVLAGSAAALKITLKNPAANPGALTDVSVDDVFTGSLKLANTSFAFTPASCGTAKKPNGDPLIVSDTSVRFRVASLAADSSCELKLNVTSATAGTLSNETSAPNAAGPVALTGTKASAALAVFTPPTVTKSFSPASIAVGDSSVMTITVTNPSANPAELSGVSIDDLYTGSLKNLEDGSLACTTENSFASLSGGAANGTSVGFSDGTLQPNESCTITQKVTATSTNVNTTGTPAASAGILALTGSAASATLTVGTYAAPTLSKAFGLTDIAVDGTAPLTFTISNPNNAPLAGIAFDDTLEEGLAADVLTDLPARPASLTAAFEPCNGAVTFESNVIKFSEGSLDAKQSCQLTVYVRGVSAGKWNNTTGKISSTESGEGAASNTATLNVYAPPVVTKTFTPAIIPAGGTSILEIKVTNPIENPGDLTGVSISDTYSGTLVNAAAGSAACSGAGSATLVNGAKDSTTVGFTNGTIEPGKTCTITQSVTATSTSANTTGEPMASGPVELIGLTSSATLTIAPAPSAKPDTNIASIGGPAVVKTAGEGLIANDSLGTPPTRVLAASQQGGSALTLDVPFTTSHGASLTIYSDGSYSYTPPSNGAGYTEVFDYTIIDHNELTAGSTLTITVSTNTNKLPYANPDQNTAVEGGPAVTRSTGEGLLSNDTLGDTSLANPTRIIAAIEQAPGTPALTLGSPFSTAIGGSLTLYADGHYSYTPPALGSVPTGGLSEVFQYTLQDNNGDLSSSTLVIKVAHNGNLLPFALPDHVYASEKQPAIVKTVAEGVLSNDILGDSSLAQPTQLIEINVGGLRYVPGESIPLSYGSSLTLNADGSYNYTPPASGVPAAGIQEVIGYVIRDNNGDISSSTLNIVVSSEQNPLPFANPNTSLAAAGSPPVVVPPESGLINDDIQGSGSAVVTGASQGGTPVPLGSPFTTPSGVVVTIFTNGSYSFTPPATGVPSSGLREVFNYTITDSAMNSSSSTLTIEITPSQGQSYAIYLPLIQKPPTITPWQLTVGFEDMPLLSGLNDYDYNDFTVSVDGSFEYANSSASQLQAAAMTFTPRTRGATFDHRFQVVIPANRFSSNGTAVLTLYDQNHQVVNTQKTVFTANTNNTYVIFPKTSDALPGSQVNTVETKPVVSLQRYATLRIEFTSQPAGDWKPGSWTDPRASSLFFDPYLVVTSTGEQIHSGDVRLLSVPSTTWQWPEEGVRIDQAYPLVKFTAGNPPTFSFPTDWWKTSTNCVFNGVKCGTP